MTSGDSSGGKKKGGSDEEKEEERWEGEGVVLRLLYALCLTLCPGQDRKSAEQKLAVISA